MIQLVGKIDDIIAVLEAAIRAGYGELPAIWCLKLYLERN